MSNILVVDDHPINRQFLSTLLSYAGHTVQEAGDGADALRAARATRPDLIITDVLMPTMDGYEFMSRVRADPALANVPTVFYTVVYREPEARALAKACGVEHIIAKPADPRDILATVGRALNAPASAQLRRKRSASDADADAVPAHPLEKEHTGLRLAALVELGIDLGLFHDPAGLLQHLCNAVNAFVPCAHAAIGALADDGVTLQRLFVDGQDCGALIVSGLRLGPDESLAEEWQRLGGIRTVREPEWADRLLPMLASTPAPAPRNFLALPIHFRGRLRGWIALADRLGAPDFSADDEGLLVTVAVQAAVAYENVRLHGALESHMEKVREEIEARLLAERRLQNHVYLLHHDPLTGLPNQIMLRDRVQRALEDAERTGVRGAVLFLDLDNFKQINDEFGHEAGDGVLREVAGRLSHAVRLGDTVARLSGDEFVILLPNLRDPAFADSMAQAVLDDLSAPFNQFGRSIAIRASIGIALFPDHGRDIASLVRHADLAMYAAKKEGGNRLRHFRGEAEGGGRPRRPSAGKESMSTETR